jgi:hypothetical protein
MTGLSRRICLAGLGALAASVASAQPPPGRGQGRGQGQGGGGPPGRGSAPDGGAAAALGALLVFSAIEQSRIREWFIANPYPVQPLPPGIARNLARGKPLPPGIAKRYAPSGLIRQLAPRPGYEILIAGAAVLLVHEATGMVHDILSEAARGR